MKKIILILMFMFVLLSSFYVYGIIDGCQSNIFATSGNTTFCTAGELDGQPTADCTNAFDFDMHNDGTGEWITDIDNPIPPNYAEATHTYNTSHGEKFNFKYLEFYARGDVGGEPQNPLNNFTFEIYKGGAWKKILDVRDVYNNTMIECRQSGKWLDAPNQPLCARYTFDNSSGVDVEKVRINVTGIRSESANKHLILPEIMGCGTPAETCSYPQLFCDDFDYTTSMYDTKGWLIQMGGGAVNTTFTPTDNRLNLTQDYFISPYHEIEPFIVSYPQDEDNTVVTSIYAPAFSSEFILYFMNGTFKYSVYDSGFARNVYTVLANRTAEGNSMNWYRYNGSDYIQICANCSNANENMDVKISSFFKHSIYYPFNSSNTINYFAIYINDSLINTSLPFVDDNALNVFEHYIIKEDDSYFSIDEYYVMAGIDRFVDTTGSFSSNYYEPTYQNETETGEDDSADFGKSVDDIWYDFGLRTARSKTMFGISLMVLMAVFVIGVMLKMHVTPNLGVIGILEFFFMILLTFLGLLPIWVVIVTVVATAGIGALYFKSQAT